MWARFSALFLLALALVKTLLLRWSDSKPLVKFAEHYGPEGIRSVSDTDAKLLSRVHRCTACGRCDADEGERVAAALGRYRGMMAFALAGARSLPDYDAAAASIDDIPEEAFSKAEALCPERVPLLELARLVRRSRVSG